MLYDREYMRDDDRTGWRSPVVILLGVLVFLFLAECFVQVYSRHSLATYFGLFYPAIARHEYWRLITYEFLHAAPWPMHILFNGIGLWFFGRSILEAMGSRRFWQLFLGAGFIGGLFEIACQAWHTRYGMAPTVGASAGVLGLAGAFCLLFPTRETCFIIYFFPVRMRSMTMFWLLFGMSVFGIVFPYGGVAHAAHLGGLLTGAAFARLGSEDALRTWWNRLLPRRPARRPEVPVPVAQAVGGRTERAPLPPPAEPDSPEDFIRREVDPILDKISAHGLQSLTERERRILEKARERMKGR